ncbi:unnamed protein product [Plutella xylostella]|uniref:(diamondback moth) hypothetical protein n=1 Tax=Plutella xylostella TaxID=51655 RepID=A0A8S4EJ03_PLUXY|nr:unnamed protein product [Plutella xylostella]
MVDFYDKMTVQVCDESNIPPYKWLWCRMKRGDSPARCTESRAHTELLTSSHRRTRREHTVKLNDTTKSSKRSLDSSRKVRLHVPAPAPLNNNHPPLRRRDDTYL